MEYLKFMGAGCIGEFSGKALEPGAWLPEVGGDLELCRNGYHFCKAEDAISWINAELYSVETRGEVLVGNDKMCARSIRMTRIPAWNERIARLFAADCAERVLPLFEKQFPGDDRPAKAVEAARLFANGRITEKQMAAAGDAAGDAAMAAGDAARHAGDAAKYVAGDAARAARYAAGDARYAWCAAKYAARHASRAAARAAGDAARYGDWAAWYGDWDAKYAAWDVAMAAARDGEIEWQAARLFEYINGEVGQ